MSEVALELMILCTVRYVTYAPVCAYTDNVIFAI